MKLNGQLTAIIENKAHIDAALIEKELHGRLQLKLEHYAMPSRFVSVEEFPRNLNDKIDLKALAKLAESQSRAST
jgi:acyl-coenzyme A synthetase/AMP-(fatty) acid ligase